MDSAVVQQIMDRLQDTTETLMQVTSEVSTQAEALAEHNTSPNAHPYIQSIIRGLDAVTVADLNDGISEHNQSASSHGLLFINHNKDTAAHGDIRAILTTLSSDMETVRAYKTYIEMLDDLFGGSNGGVPAIDTLNTRVGTVESGLNSTNTNVSGLSTRVSTLETSQGVQDQRLNNLESTVSAHTISINDLRTQMTSLTGRVTILESLSGGLDLSALTHNVPNTVKAGTPYTIKFSGMTVPAGDSLSFSISGQSAGLTFSKTTGIALNENITMTVGGSITAGTILSFNVKGALGSGPNAATTISTRVSSLPDMNTLIVSGIPSLVVPGTAYNYSFTAATDADGNAITYSITSCSSGTCTVNSATRTGVFTPDANATAGSSVNFVIRATTTNGYTEKTVTTTVAAKPVVTNLTCNQPAYVKPSNSYSIKLSGATSTNGGTITYAIAAKSGSVVSFTPATGIKDNDAITLTVPSNATRGSVQTFVVTVTDGAGATTTKEFTTKVNSLPVVTNVGTSPSINGQTVSTTQATSFAIIGATDADSGQTYTYDIESPTTGLSFSKTTGIAENESITLNVTKVSTATQHTFNIRAVDALGEKSTAVKTITFTANPVYIAEQPTITSPTEGQVMPTDAFTFTFSEISVVVSV